MTQFTTLSGTALHARNEAKKKNINSAVTELKIPENELIVRQLRPEDIGLSPTIAGEWTFSLSAGNNTIVDSKNIADNRFVSIYGVRIAQSAAQVSVQAKITRENQDKRFWPLQGVSLTRDSTFYYDDPVTIRQNTPITIVVSANGTNTAEKLVFLGDVVERKGILVA
jgi:hypothetical protein